MGTVTVQGRDELGRLIDVTLTTSADVAPPGPEVVSGGGGGSLTLDNTVDAPAEVTTIIAVGAEIAGDEATLRGKDFYAQDTDPGAVGAGSVWKDTSGLPYNWYERNATDDGWDARVRVTATATGADNTDVGTTAIVVDGGAIADSSAEATGDGGASAQINATSVTGEALAYQVAATTDGVADAHAAATATGTGTADTTSTSTADSGDASSGALAIATTGDATSGISAMRGAVEASVLVDSTAANARVLAVASDISATATDVLTLTGTGSVGVNSDGDIVLSPLGQVRVGSGSMDIGSVVIAADIPTIDPGVAGQLWADTGTLKVSAG